MSFLLFMTILYTFILFFSIEKRIEKNSKMCYNINIKGVEIIKYIISNYTKNGRNNYE